MLLCDYCLELYYIMLYYIIDIISHSIYAEMREKHTSTYMKINGRRGGGGAATQKRVMFASLVIVFIL